MLRVLIAPKRKVQQGGSLRPSTIFLSVDMAFGLIQSTSCYELIL
uniref:Uncharacterized protein n=1 Tax=Candidatus Kentrum sp. MB TaxID=2138164 RepID=A0A450Y1H2_9GAMM|nr:MAG: hypothetical protein BECKMB1821G_GA0114241_11147 [Candidatus Kentron sp. MB]VFK35398.1 MAG: hypothetical protein BECKMB1821I_GA0114274_11161 [Candidatus Kentron sp. MB]VFK77029.1 MAG: hypothetical protein BECKMB1821H_GA0114242_10923 [Candidatus Kentron sp. MB]